MKSLTLSTRAKVRIYWGNFVATAILALIASPVAFAVTKYFDWHLGWVAAALTAGGVTLLAYTTATRQINIAIAERRAWVRELRGLELPLLAARRHFQGDELPSDTL